MQTSIHNDEKFNDSKKKRLLDHLQQELESPKRKRMKNNVKNALPKNIKNFLSEIVQIEEYSQLQRPNSKGDSIFHFIEEKKHAKPKKKRGRKKKNFEEDIAVVYSVGSPELISSMNTKKSKLSLSPENSKSLIFHSPDSKKQQSLTFSPFRKLSPHTLEFILNHNDDDNNNNNKKKNNQKKKRKKKDRGLTWEQMILNDGVIGDEESIEVSPRLNTRTLTSIQTHQVKDNFDIMFSLDCNFYNYNI